jgi:hypothetical protein
MWVIEPKRMRWKGHVACVEKRLLLDSGWGDPEEK